MKGVLYWAAALALVLAGVALVLAEAHDIWRAREFWRAMRFGQAQPVPSFWDSRYLTAELRLATPRVVLGVVLGLAGGALAGLRLYRHRAQRS